MSYSQDLLTIPSNTGKGIPVSINYQPGISVQQASGETGLGWNLGIGGAITRSVVGVPDDCEECLTYGFKSFAPNGKQTGAMYFKSGAINQVSTGWSVDISSSKYLSDSIEYYTVSYDNYSISGPGIGGALTPNLYDYGHIKTNQDYGGFDVSGFTKKMQFTVNGDFHDTLISRHYPTAINGSTTLRLPGSSVTDYYTSDTRPFMGAEYNGSGTMIGDENFNHSTNRPVTPYYVEYFTNAEIHAGVSGFLNYESGHSRNSGRYYDMGDGIGGYRVTDPAGYVYHYSLPVYFNGSVNYTFPLNNEYVMEKLDDYNNFDPACANSAESNIITPYPGQLKNKFLEYKEHSKYAYQWLLTAVTGPDYVDSNSDGMANTGDAGYWVSYDNQLWASNYKKRTPEYGYNLLFDESAGYDDPFIPGVGMQTPYFELQSKLGTISISDLELFYLNSIKTSSHSALIIRETRKDEFSELTSYDATLPIHGTLNENNLGVEYYSFNGKITASTSSYPSGYNWYGTIKPEGAETLSVVINSLAAGSTLQLRSNNSSGTVLANLTSASSFPYTVTAPTGAVWLSHTTSAVNQAFSMSWTTIKKKTYPQLNVGKIILIKNTDLASLPTLTSFSTPTGFSLASTNNSANKFYNSDWYTTNKTAIDALSLQTVAFTYDYSLCKKYQRNINTLADDSLGFKNWNEVPSYVSIVSGQTANSGKLTLKEITTYGLNYTKAMPSYQFDYNDASSTDNPDYDARAADYWGYYKSDFAAPALSRYTTSTSKDYTDAWSLRKITLPSGGTTEFTYESNSYEKVWAEKGGYRGAAKIYPIAAVYYYEDNSSERAGKKWHIRMENPSLSDFTSLQSSPPSGTTKFIYIPSGDGGRDYISCGTFSFKTSPLRVTNVQKVYYSPTYDDKYNLDSDSSKFNELMYNGGDTSSYNGNGYIQFELPQTYTSYGGGIRVKKITMRNGVSGEAYEKEYVYENGVATSEPDRYAYPKPYRDWNRGDLMFTELTSFTIDKYGVGPSIGYGKVTERNLGVASTAQGEIINTFNIANNEMDSDVLNVQSRSTTYGSPYCTFTPSTTDTSYIVELNNKGKNYWGVLKEEKITDVNANILSLKKYTYASTQQGAAIEVLDAENVNGYPFCSPTNTHVPPVNCNSCLRYNHTVTIIRNYRLIPVMETNYMPGGLISSSQALRTDEITGQAVESISIAPNKSIRKEKVIPAFRISNYVTSGPKALNSTYTNQLGLSAATKISVDTTISGGGDFAQLTAATYSKTFNFRGCSVEDGYTTTAATDFGFWLNSRSYTWGGVAGSVNTYGLYKGSEATSYPFNYTSPDSNDERWRFNGEVNLLDSKTHVLENIGYNNVCSATKYDLEENQEIASVSNCNYQSFTFTSFEENKTWTDGVITKVYYTGEVSKVGTTTTQTSNGTRDAHTGTKFISVASGNGPTYSVKYEGTGSKGEEQGLLRGRTYRASVWIHADSPSDAKLLIKLTGT
ncbi:MAG TPA: hypothetical protein VGF30_05590, partial [Bacteroidia bacterium]